MGAVEDATRTEVDQLRVGPVAPGLTAAALALARQLDDAEDAKGAAAAARELRAIMSDLRKLAPVESKGDAVDDIAQQREKRRAAAREQAAGG
ncbi:hypothetical protein [Streptomyces hygroscopicus]|uniref:hypothetical protein n=1 Tax=Streptomyces hygroscopicus TaxID=1912 RepID=UPI0007678D4C|nr:hypothetical protein [Streptomyces hygroscopicus]